MGGFREPIFSGGEVHMFLQFADQEYAANPPEC